MEKSEEPREIARDMTRKEYKTLAAIWNNGSEARTSEITATSDDLYTQLVNSHYQKMVPAGLIEKVDEGRGEGASNLPREGYCYRITDRGRDVLLAAQEDYGMDPLEEGVVRRRLDELGGRLGAVEATLQEDVDKSGSETTIADLEERIDELESYVKGLTGDMEKVVDMVRDLEDDDE